MRVVSVVVRTGMTPCSADCSRSGSRNATTTAKLQTGLLPIRGSVPPTSRHLCNTSCSV